MSAPKPMKKKLLVEKIQLQLFWFGTKSVKGYLIKKAKKQVTTSGVKQIVKSTLAELGQTLFQLLQLHEETKAKSGDEGMEGNDDKGNDDKVENSQGEEEDEDDTIDDDNDEENDEFGVILRVGVDGSLGFSVRNDAVYGVLISAVFADGLLISSSDRDATNTQVRKFGGEKVVSAEHISELKKKCMKASKNNDTSRELIISFCNCVDSSYVGICV